MLGRAMRLGAMLWLGAHDAPGAFRWRPEKRSLELRLEAFNLFNTFNWGIPGTELTAGGWQANFNAGTFGRITTQQGSPRIIQLGFKYTF